MNVRQDSKLTKQDAKRKNSGDHGKRKKTDIKHQTPNNKYVVHVSRFHRKTLQGRWSG